MTAMAQNSELGLFVTHVETDGPLLKIWGQIDRNAATCVERMILPLSEKFAQGLALPNPGYPLTPNMICCARFQNEGYYRAKICNVQPNGNVLVHFMDYGNYEVLPPTAIRLLDNIPSAVSLHALPPLALDFVLAHILPINGTWESGTIESIKQTLRYADLKGILHSVIGSRRLLKLFYNNEDFGALLVSKELAVSVTLQDMFAAHQRATQPRVPQMLRESVAPSLGHNYSPRPQHNMYTESSPRSNPPVQEDWRSPQHRIPPVTAPPPASAPAPAPAPTPEALVFKSRVLDVGSMHDVYVSFVEDGPMKFSVQVKSTAQILTQLMADVNNHPTAPLQEPPLPGSVCLGRYSLEGVLCRAVVMSVMEQKCKLFYVDFGHTEVLSYSDIFQLPPQFIQPKVLSIRFTLSGLKELNITDEVKDYFKKIVTGRPLVLHVRPPEGPPLIQYGDLYDGGVNVRDVLKKTFPSSAPVFYQEAPMLKQGFKDMIHVSFVESYTKFFVQLDSGIKSLTSVMACLAEYASKAPPLDEKTLQVGRPCCASYVEDKQWYRAQILNINGEQATVLYVDYGNQETVAVSTLRRIHDDLVVNLRAQAISCVLNGFQSTPFNQELADQFELIVLEKKLAMEVIDVLPNGTLVDLYDCTVAPMASIASQIKVSSQPRRPISSPNNAHTANEQVINLSPNLESNYQSDDRNGKWGKSGKSNTCGQETRSSEWGSKSRKPQFDQNNHYERPLNKIVKEVENEQRQRDSNRHNGEERLHQSETRNNHFNRNEPGGGNRFDRNDDSGSRRGRGGRFGSRDGNPRDDNRFEKNLGKDDSFSDRDSDTSSRGSSRRGSKGSRGIKGRGDRGSRRGGERKQASGKWSDGDSDRSSTKSNQSTGFRSRDRNSSNSSWKNPKANKSSSWNSMSPTSPVKDTPRGQKLKIPPPNITVGAAKDVEIIYTNSPTDFYVQLCPDNVELDTVMEKIAQTYNDGGKIVRRSDLQKGLCCVAQYSSDSKWYRAVVQTNKADSASVHFIDYGNAETVVNDKIKEIQPDLAKLSAQAVHCKLFGATKTTWSDEEIDTFAQSTEGIPLEAEFILQSNEVYEVLLKYTGDNGLEPKYVNQQFCGNLDLQQAKKDARNITRNDRRKPARVTPQYIPAGQKWNDESFASGYQVDVVVTWFVNPNNFYCQILSKQSEFRNMMNEIQDAYVDQQPIKSTLQVGAPVIAFFSDDGALYRAEIKELNKLRGHIVQYIDFGNCAMVDPCKIYPVEQRFAKLPKQAMHCTLSNILPATGIDWSKANKHEIDKYFDADKFKCTFHGTKDGKYLISLNNRGKDIAESMITIGLAINSNHVTEKSAINNVTLAEQCKPIPGVEKEDPALWSGQTIRTKVCNIQGAAKFYIQLPPLIESQQAVDNLMSSTNAGHLAECYLNVTPTPQIDEKLKKSIEGKELIVCINSVNNQRFAVQLYDLLGQKIKILETDTDDSIGPICPLAVFASTQKVWVTHIDNAESIWLQRSTDLDKIAEVLSSLYEYYSASGTQLVPEVGKLCAAKSEDKNWYRAMVESVKDTNVVVRFIDYGNCEEVPCSGIRNLEPQFYVPHQMAIKVSLIVNLKGSEEEQKTLLHLHLDDKEFTANFYNMGKKWIVELTENDKKMSQILSEQGIVVEFKKTEPEQQEIPEMIVGNKYKVFLSHSDSPAQFWLQRNEEIEAINVMQANLQLAAPNFAPITGIPEEGTLCAALYSVDSMWYRAEVLDADEDITTVRFIDYGNTDVVDSNSSNIKELPQNLKSIKKYGLKSRLDLIPTGSEDWSTASCEMFETMATSTDAPITALIIADSVPRRVELFVDDKSVGDALVNEGHAIMVHNAEDLIDEIIDLELDPRSAFVSHVNSPSEFWVQEEKSVSDLETMTDRFIVAEMFPKLKDIVEGSLCVAKFPDDELWYRARVKSYGPAGTQVLYIDYGNSAVSTEIRTIPEDLAAVPPLSRKCCLKLPLGVKEWSVNASNKFIDLAADGATIFLLDVIEEGETSVVNLTLDGTNVADQLIQYCEVLPVIDERLPPLGEENSPNVVVSHVNSPSEFWTQAESSITELEIMASRLLDAQSLLPLNTFDKGTICAAKFPDDGEWYRSKILSHSEGVGTTVLYFDYGNSALTTELRILPEDVANIPSLATRCTLALPSDVESWSEEACEKFNELVADGVTMFQFELLDNNDPTLISLQLEGNDVVDILKPLCTKKVSSENKAISDSETAKVIETIEKDESEVEIIRTEITHSEEAKIDKNSKHDQDEIQIIETAKVIETIEKDENEVEIIRTEITHSEEAKIDKTSEHDQGEIQIIETVISDSETANMIQTSEKDQSNLEIIETVITDSETVKVIHISEKEEDEVEIIETLENGNEVIKEENISYKIEADEVQINGDTCQDDIIQTDKLETAIISDSNEAKDTPINGSKNLTEIGQPQTDKPVASEAKNNQADVCKAQQPSVYIFDIPKAPAPTPIDRLDALKIKQITDTSTVTGKSEIVEEEEKSTETLTALATEEKTELPEHESKVNPELLVPKLEPNLEEPEANAETEDAINVIKSSANLEVDHPEAPVLRSSIVESSSEVTTTEIKVIEEAAINGTVEYSKVKEESNYAAVEVSGDESVPERVTKAEPVSAKTEEHSQPTYDVSRDGEVVTPKKTPKIDKIVPGSVSRGSMEDDIPVSMLSQRRSSCSDDKIVPGSINKGNDLSRAESSDSLHQEIVDAISGVTKVEAKEETAPVTLGKTQLENKIVPGSISRGESPSIEQNRPVTPKTPHSEKLLAGAVNLQENLSDFDEQDEILTVEVENNIPKYRL
ncbi:maternal protein tudor isoform X1 [Neodiprion fabricii]|uniref:maternal protein tudor isoform X1 n=1 Tax=Neodiprion fabricii TaxID=2872261 RepID=UPI001ED967EF|nr:maternal protein tudor isoform X1 [Neodiprion fabricii]